MDQSPLRTNQIAAHQFDAPAKITPLPYHAANEASHPVILGGAPAHYRVIAQQLID